MLQGSTLDYVMCDSEGLFDPLKGHNKIQKMKNKQFFFKNSILASNNEAKNWKTGRVYQEAQ